MIGSTLGHYEILSLLGEGGMGQVYRARDTKLGREVALKVLPAGTALDPDRRMRFDREARAVAALTHPHIVTIYSVEEVGDTHFLTMEMVDGETLSDLIPPQGMSLERFFAVAIPLIEAVAAAHQKGITHRDLKPANIMVNRDKQLKVLDFGLAKLIEGDPADKRTMADGATAEGRILGTVAYMSPEQAEGKAVDHRSDIFSLGVLLYEMATGIRPFKGDTNISTITSILRDDPQSVTELKQTLPRHLGRIIRRCLAKDPDRRYQTALDLRNDVQELKDEIASGELEIPAGETAGTGVRRPSSTGGSSTQVDLRAPASGRRRLILGGAVVAVIAIAAVAGIKLFSRPSTRPAPLSPAGSAMTMTRLTNTGKSVEAAISPDGKMVAHVQLDKGASSLWLTQVATQSSVEIMPATDAGIWDPTFDPKGEFIYFCRQDKGADIPDLYRIPALGGTPRKLMSGVDQTVSFSPDGNRFAFLRTDPGTPRTSIMIANADGTGEKTLATKEVPQGFTENPSWSPDGTLVAAPVQSLTSGVQAYVVGLPVDGGPERRLSPKTWLGVQEMAWLPDGSGLVLAAQETPIGGQLWELDVPSGDVRRITNDVNTYNGVSLTADGRTLAVGIDEPDYALEVVSPERASEPTVLTHGRNRFDGLPGVSWTPDGHIVYSAGVDGDLLILGIGSSGGESHRITQSLSVLPDVSPDGRSIVYIAIHDGIHVWKCDIDGSHAVQLTHGTIEGNPKWSPDGKWVLYAGGIERQVCKVSAEGGDSTLVSPIKGVDGFIVSPDGSRLAVRAWDAAAGKTRTFIVPVTGGEPTATLDIPPGEGQWSPDGRSITYVDTKDGVSNLWEQPLSGGPPRRITRFTEDQIPAFAWSRDGKRIALSRGSETSDVVLITDFR